MARERDIYIYIYIYICIYIYISVNIVPWGIAIHVWCRGHLWSVLPQLEISGQAMNRLGLQIASVLFVTWTAWRWMMVGLGRGPGSGLMCAGRIWKIWKELARHIFFLVMLVDRGSFPSREFADSRVEKTIQSHLKWCFLLRHYHGAIPKIEFRSVKLCAALWVPFVWRYLGYIHILSYSSSQLLW